MEVSNHCLDVCQQCLDLEKHALTCTDYLITL